MCSNHSPTWKWRGLAFLLGCIIGLVVAALPRCGHANEVSGFKVTILSAGTHETYFYSGCQILFESNVHKAFEASCSKRKIAGRPFQAEPKTKDYALLVNDKFFYDCELVGMWTGSNPHSGQYYGNRIWHCGGMLEDYTPRREGEP